MNALPQNQGQQLSHREVPECAGETALKAPLHKGPSAQMQGSLWCLLPYLFQSQKEKGVGH